MRLRVDPQRVSARKLEPCVDALRRGGVVIYPTDTGYAYGCALDQRKGIERLRRLKGLGPKDYRPLTMLVDSMATMSHYGHVDNQCFRMIRRLLPGPYTIVLRAASTLPRDLRNRSGDIGMRIPDHPVCQLLLEGLGVPMFTASVFSAAQADHMEEPEELWESGSRDVDVMVDVGPLWPDPSTVLRIEFGEVEVLREGAGALP